MAPIIQNKLKIITTQVVLKQSMEKQYPYEDFIQEFNLWGEEDCVIGRGCGGIQSVADDIKKTLQRCKFKNNKGLTATYSIKLWKLGLGGGNPRPSPSPSLYERLPVIAL